MKLDLLTAISPIVGRYRGKTDVLAAYFSEFALIKYRVQVEIEYFITLCELPLPQLKGVDKGVFETLRNIYRNFSEADAQRIKDIESVTNHDVKAVEYFLKEEFDKLPDLIILDEPLHGLDVSNKKKAAAIIEQFCSRPGKTLIYVTHYPHELPACVDKRFELVKHA